MHVEGFTPKGGWVKAPEGGVIYAPTPVEFVRALLRKKECVVTSIQNETTGVLVKSFRLNNGRYVESTVAFSGAEIRDGELSAFLLKLNLPIEAIQL